MSIEIAWHLSQHIRKVTQRFWFCRRHRMTFPKQLLFSSSLQLLYHLDAEAFLFSVRPSSCFSPFTVVRPTQIFGIFKKKRNDVVTPFFTWNNSFNLKNEHSNSIEKNRNKNMNIFHSILCILLIQICECLLLTSSWGTRAYYSETSCDFFLGFFFFSIRPTDPISGNAFDGKRRKKRWWPKEEVEIFYIKWLTLVFQVHSLSKQGDVIELL